jgi:hypothetical protein
MNNTEQKLKPVYSLLKAVFIIVPIVAGLDKFTNILTNWEMYLHPAIARMLPFSPHVFMIIVGVIEIAAGLIVLAKPKIGSAIVSAWLVCIALQLLAGGHFLDVAVRDLVMAVSAFTLFKISGIGESSERQ